MSSLPPSEDAKASPVADPYRRTRDHYVEPPQTFWQSLKYLGPGMILIGSVVGSGELIMTTKLGAETGFILLWFVLLSCLIKVVVQGELGRFTISSGETFLESFNQLPGPCGQRPKWLDVPWMFVVLVTSIVALGLYSSLEAPRLWQTCAIIDLTVISWLAVAFISSSMARPKKVALLCLLVYVTAFHFPAINPYYNTGIRADQVNDLPLFGYQAFCYGLFVPWVWAANPLLWTGLFCFAREQYKRALGFGSSATVAALLGIFLALDIYLGYLLWLASMSLLVCAAGYCWRAERRRSGQLAGRQGDSRDQAAGGSEGEMGARPVLNWVVWIWLVTVLVMFINGGAILGATGQALALAFPDVPMPQGTTGWALVVAVLSALILLTGSYRLLEGISVGLVACFTFLTIFCTCLLQKTGYAISPQQLQAGLTFNLPGNIDSAVVMTALAMYAGTGIGANEMMSYTYWCVEKGYARNVGQRQPGLEWARRASGWIRVMYTDVYLTLIVYTVSTICFFFLGAAVLNAKQMNPEGAETVKVLGGIYTETLGSWAATMFVVGAFFVLFSTVLSGVAGATRAMADGLCVMGIIDADDPKARFRLMRVFAVVALATHVLAYSMFENPPLMLMISSLVSVVLYPIVGVGTIYFRYRRVDERIMPGRVNSVLLWICGVVVIGVPPLVALFSWALKNRWIVLQFEDAGP